MVSQQPTPANEPSIPELALKLVGTAGGIVAGLRFLWEALSGEAPSVYNLVAYAGTAGIGAVLGMVALGLVVGIGVFAVGKSDEVADNETVIKVTNAIGAAAGALVSVLFGGTDTDYPWLLQAIGVAVLLLLAYTIVVGRLPDL